MAPLLFIKNMCQLYEQSTGSVINMSKGIISTHGLKYILSDEIYAKVITADNGTNNILGRLNQVIENAEIFNSFCGTLTFCLIPFITIINWYSIVSIALLAYFFSTLLSNCVAIFKSSFLSIILYGYQLATKLWLHYIAIILVSIFLIKCWYASLIYIILALFLNITMTFIIGGYDKRRPFNDRAALALLKVFATENAQ